MDENELISEAMAVLGRRKSEKKTASGRANMAKALAASVTDEARQKRSEAQKARWARIKAEKEAQA